MFSMDFSVIEAGQEPVNGRRQNGADVRGKGEALREKEEEEL